MINPIEYNRIILSSYNRFFLFMLVTYNLLTRIKVVFLVEGGVMMSSPGGANGVFVVVVPLVFDGDGFKIGSERDARDLTLRSFPFGQTLARVRLHALSAVQAR